MVQSSRVTKQEGISHGVGKCVGRSDSLRDSSRSDVQDSCFNGDQLSSKSSE